MSATLRLCPWCGRPMEGHERVSTFDGGVAAYVCDEAVPGVLAAPIEVPRLVGTDEPQPWGEAYSRG